MSGNNDSSDSVNFLTRANAAKAIGISENEEYFSEIWKRIAIVASIIRDEGSNRVMTIGIHGVDITITLAKTKIRDIEILDPEGGFVCNDILLSNDLIPILEKVYFEYAPHNSLTPTDSTELKKGRFVTSTEAPKKKRPIIHIKIPVKTGGLLNAEEIASFLGAPLGTIKNRLQPIKQEYDKYWIAENNYNFNASSVSKTRPNPSIEVQINERGINRGNSRGVVLKVPEDITVARFEKGYFKTERAFCVNKDKVKYLFPDLYLKKIFQKYGIEIEEAGEHFTSRTFCEKFLDGLDRTSFDRLTLAIKEQYDSFLAKGKKTSGADWKELGVFIDGITLPVSMFCYGKTTIERSGKFGFFIKGEALPLISSIPEVGARLNKNNSSWMSLRKANVYFSKYLGVIGDDIEMQKNFTRAQRDLGEVSKAREKWLSAAQNKFAESGAHLSSYDSENEYFYYRGNKIKAVETCYTNPSGGAAGLVAKRDEFFKLFDALDFTTKLPTQNTKKITIPKNQEHWFNFVSRLQNSVAPNLSAVVGNFSILILAKMINGAEEGVFRHNYKDAKQTTSLSLAAKQSLAEQLSAALQEVYGLELSFDRKIFSLPKLALGAKNR